MLSATALESRVTGAKQVWASVDSRNLATVRTLQGRLRANPFSPNITEVAASGKKGKLDPVLLTDQHNLGGLLGPSVPLVLTHKPNQAGKQGLGL